MNWCPSIRPPPEEVRRSPCWPGMAVRSPWGSTTTWRWCCPPRRAPCCSLPPCSSTSSVRLRHAWRCACRAFDVCLTTMVIRHGDVATHGSTEFRRLGADGAFRTLGAPNQQWRSPPVLRRPSMSPAPTDPQMRVPHLVGGVRSSIATARELRPRVIRRGGSSSMTPSCSTWPPLPGFRWCARGRRLTPAQPTGATRSPPP